MNVYLKTFLIIFAGSGFGGAARYFTQLLILKIYPSAFPFGTLTVNVAGCFLIGLFYAAAEKEGWLTPDWRMALTTGFCGGFTTFSTFAYENLILIKTGNYLFFTLYLLLSIILGIAAVYFAILIVKYF